MLNDNRKIDYRMDSRSRVSIIDSQNGYGVVTALRTARLLALLTIKWSAILRCVWWPGCRLAC